MNNINNINEMPRNPEWDEPTLSTEGREGAALRLPPEDLVARAKASIMAASASQTSDEFSPPLQEQSGPAVDMRVGLEVEPTVTQPMAEPAPRAYATEPVPQAAIFQSGVRNHDINEDLEAEAEIKVRVKTGDLLYTRADLMVRRDNHLSAVVDGVLLDLGMINTDLMNAMALAHQVHVSAGHYLGGIIERRVPLVHQ